jgi:hypothetical protein
LYPFSNAARKVTEIIDRWNLGAKLFLDGTVVSILESRFESKDVTRSATGHNAE